MKMQGTHGLVQNLSIKPNIRHVVEYVISNTPPQKSSCESYQKNPEPLFCIFSFTKYFSQRLHTSVQICPYALHSQQPPVQIVALRLEQLNVADQLRSPFITALRNPLQFPLKIIIIKQHARFVDNLVLHRVICLVAVRVRHTASKIPFNKQPITTKEITTRQFILGLGNMLTPNIVCILITRPIQTRRQYGYFTDLTLLLTLDALK